MRSSAILSSSPVVAPGFTCSPSSDSVSATTAPALAIWSSSRADLRMITSGRRPARAPAGDRLRGIVDAILELGAAAQSFDRDRVRQLQREDDRELAADLVEHRVERVGLRRGARET